VPPRPSGAARNPERRAYAPPDRIASYVERVDRLRGHALGTDVARGYMVNCADSACQGPLIKPVDDCQPPFQVV
jgi:hypothetical protein